MEFTVSVKQDVPVKTLKASMGVRYWEDGKVNGVDDDNDTPNMPLKSGDVWHIFVDLATGKIDGWPEGVEAETHYKVCDDGVYSLLNEAGETVLERNDYVPQMLSPGGSGYGDYVIMKIDGNGLIENWRVDLSCFEEDDETQ